MNFFCVCFVVILKNIFLVYGFKMGVFFFIKYGRKISLFVSGFVSFVFWFIKMYGFLLINLNAVFLMCVKLFLNYLRESLVFCVIFIICYFFGIV